MNVLSLFDGMSCGRIALTELNIKIDQYYASEIDSHAIKQTQLNFPTTIQLGDVTKWQEWHVKWSEINLILAGSPCQGFSFAGKQLAFDDPRSKLFFVFVEILNHVKKFNPDVKFLLENVDMKRDHLRVISEYVGVFPVNINSNLVSAQNRNRWYWTNIRTKKVGLFDEIYTDIPQPKDEGILLRDILESEVDEKYFLSDKMVNGLQNHSDKKQNEGCGFKFEPKKAEQKGAAVTSRCFKMGVDDNYIVAMRGRNPDNPSDRRTGSPTEQRLEPNTTGKTNCLTSVQKDNLIVSMKLGRSPDFQRQNQSQKAYALDTKGKDGFALNSRIRRLTPTECARLQTVPPWYVWNCSDTQQYRMLGNGWTVKVIEHILSFMT